VAVDIAGNVYITGGADLGVVKLAASSSSQTRLPSAGLTDPQGVAVNAVGIVYVVDSYDNRVVKLLPG
jgi:serine/threonine protein kinase, bacterial